MKNLDLRSFFAALAVAVIIALGCAGCTPPAAERDAAPPSDATSEGDRAALLDAHLAFMRAMERGDVDGVSALLDDSGDLLIFHPMSADRFDGIEQVREGLRTMFGREGDRSWNEYHPLLKLDGNVGWITSHSVLEAPGKRAGIALRGTEIWRRRGGSWRLVHAHWSVQP